MKNSMVLFSVMLYLIAPTLMAGNDPSIKGNQRLGIQTAMGQHVDANTVKGSYVIYDVTQGEIKKLQLKELHSGIVKKGEFYVSCADFVDNQGKLYDLDFLVSPSADGFRVIQAIVHSVDGNKRKYHVES